MIMNHMTAALAAVVASAATSAAAEPRIFWDLPVEYQVDSLPGTVAKKFAAEVGERSNGEIKVTIHFGAALGYKSVDQFDAVTDGALPLASSFAGAWGGIDPIFLVASLPVIAPTIEDSRTLYAASKPYFKESLASADQKLLAVTPWPNNGIWSSETLATTSDLKGLRIRTFDPLGTITFGEIGAAPVQLSWADVIPQLSTGALEAVLTSADGGSAASLWDLLPSYTQVPYASPWQILHMNRGVYDDLGTDEKGWVDEAARAAEEYGWDLVAERTAENFAEMRGHEMQIEESVPASFIDALAAAGQTAVEQWKSDTGARADSLLDTYEAEKAK